MKKSLTKVLAVLMSLAIVASALSGCGGKETAEEIAAETIVETAEESYDDTEEDYYGDEDAYDDDYADSGDSNTEAIAGITYEVDPYADTADAIDAIYEDYESNTWVSGDRMYASRPGVNEYPEYFDLRDYGVVTPVKAQYPWGACWSFGVCAACEISILSALDKTYDETGLDLSEHHLAWFAQSHVTEDGPYKDEGIHYNESEQPMDDGGFGGLGASVIANGVGVALEADYPYCDAEGKRTDYGDWSLPDSERNVQEYQLKEVKYLSNAMVRRDYDWMKDDWAIERIKDELLEGHGVTLSYEFGQYSEAYGHYSESGPDSANHTVCIVGWDDNFPVENFCCIDEDGNEAPLPKEPGAWIVKNSWGAETEGSQQGPNRFGVENEKGEATGYFYLSYEDNTAHDFISYSFDVENKYRINQHDNLQDFEVRGWASSYPYAMANVFVADRDEDLECISVNTSTPETAVRYSVYFLDGTEDNPAEGELVAQLEGYYVESGIHREDLFEPIPLTEGQKYAIVVDAYTINELVEGYMVYGTENQNKDMYEGDTDYVSYGCARVNSGESYIYSGRYKCWIDYSQVVEYRPRKLWDMDNFPIKAYTR